MSILPGGGAFGSLPQSFSVIGRFTSSRNPIAFPLGSVNIRPLRRCPAFSGPATQRSPHQLMKERPVDRAHPGLRCGLRRLSWLLGFGALIALHGHAQTAFISDAWWTFQQDCNGDGCKAGSLPGDFARLNWSANVVDCNGILSVFEIIYSRPSGSVNWTALYTNASHRSEEHTSELQSRLHLVCR